ncbi:MAG: hypothetical protein AB4290_12050 [Spirulina sp.]
MRNKVLYDEYGVIREAWKILPAEFRDDFISPERHDPVIKVIQSKEYRYKKSQTQQKEAKKGKKKKK